MRALKDIFEEHKDARFVFVYPGGNMGDRLICLGATKLAAQIGIKCRAVHYRAKRRSNGALNLYCKDPVGADDIIYVSGCGGYTSWCGLAGPLLRAIRRDHPDNLVIVGPSTASLELQYLRQVLPRDDGRIVFFARERTSYDFIKANFYSHTYLDHDTSLWLSKEDTLFRKFLRSFVPNIEIGSKPDVVFLRADVEKTPPPSIREDHAVVCDPVLFYRQRPCPLKWISPRSRLAERKWLRLHLEASRITTNRLHSAIFGTILGKDVELFRNSYHKNRSVWEYSLKDRGVKWIE